MCLLKIWGKDRQEKILSEYRKLRACHSSEHAGNLWVMSHRIKPEGEELTGKKRTHAEDAGKNEGEKQDA